MSKAVLVMDMPESCADCKLRINGCCLPRSWKNDICGVYYDAKNSSKPDWCPLRPMPEKRECNGLLDFDDSVSYGFNLCIDAICGGDSE